MLRHDNISVDAKPEPASDPLQPQLEHSLAGCRREQRTTPVAAEGYEVGLAGLLKSLQSPRHRASLRPANSPLKPKDGLSCLDKSEGSIESGRPGLRTKASRKERSLRT